MLRYLLSKIFIFIITLWIIFTVSFLLMKAIPGNPFIGERALSPSIMHNLLVRYGLDKSLWNQYWSYLSGVLHGDFGLSYKMPNYTVYELISSAAPVSIILALWATVLSLILGVFAGVIAALKHNTGADYTIMGISMVGIVLPSFAIAPILALLFGVYWGILPVAGWGGWQYMVLPIVALGLSQVSYIARLTRGSMLEVLGSGYIRTAYAKGLPTKSIIFNHALKPALMPVISYLGPTIATLMAGSVVIETIFDVPGLGRYIVKSSLARDYNVVLGITLLYAFLILLLNLLSDILYAFLDPRIKTS